MTFRLLALLPLAAALLLPALAQEPVPPLSTGESADTLEPSEGSGRPFVHGHRIQTFGIP